MAVNTEFLTAQQSPPYGVPKRSPSGLITTKLDVRLESLTYPKISKVPPFG